MIVFFSSSENCGFYDMFNILIFKPPFFGDGSQIHHMCSTFGRLHYKKIDDKIHEIFKKLKNPLHLGSINEVNNFLSLMKII